MKTPNALDWVVQNNTIYNKAATLDYHTENYARWHSFMMDEGTAREIAALLSKATGVPWNAVQAPPEAGEPGRQALVPGGDFFIAHVDSVKADEGAYWLVGAHNDVGRFELRLDAVAAGALADKLTDVTGLVFLETARGWRENVGGVGGRDWKAAVQDLTDAIKNVQSAVDIAEGIYDADRDQIDEAINDLRTAAKDVKAAIAALQSG